MSKITVFLESKKKQRGKDSGLELHERIPANTTVMGLKQLVGERVKLSPHRISLSFKDSNKVVNASPNTPLAEAGIMDGTQLWFKDFGPQIGYRTVFIVEYAGPLFIMMLYALRPELLYGEGAQSQPFSDVAKMGVACWIAHFVKRELETLFVHKFSHPTMPLFNLFKNSIYYWSFGVLCGYTLCHPLYTPTENETAVMAGLVIFIISELGNLLVHIQLSRLRPSEGSTLRPIPKGFLFSLVSCPNYTFEALSWVGFSLMTSTAFGWLFCFMGAAQMFAWAQKKHIGYIRTYGKEYKNLRRKAMIPFLA
eukprot:TRINITY_DN59520_c0_g1_i1.p1 TRINITY_DN59520_c0_g1~~TRINITY_DN59520_c0_g1_i1.p1  ORF type:complete len:320 (-),score=2.26 TRINITY_DN59520_c0_g1_i1:135-1061(-)